MEPECHDGNSGLDSLLSLLESVVLEGLRHGFFDCALTCEIVKGGKRQLIIKAGKNYKFYVAEDEMKKYSSQTRATPVIGAREDHEVKRSLAIGGIPKPSTTKTVSPAGDSSVLGTADGREESEA